MIPIKGSFTSGFRWVNGLEFAPCVVDRHVPVYAALPLVHVTGPPPDFTPYRVRIANPAVPDAPAPNAAGLVLRDAQPPAMFRRASELGPLHQHPRPGCIELLLLGSLGVRVQIVRVMFRPALCGR